jgi:hypothetical protein
MIKLIDILNEKQITPDDINRILKRTGEEQDLVDPDWDDFTPEICNDGFCDIFAEKFQEEYPRAELWGTDWGLGFTMGHVWIKYKGKFYDAETPHGVKDWRELPYIQKLYKAENQYPDDVEKIE